MWISGGDHELGDNIVHLVLAKVPGGPPGVKGISLFIVPKFRLDDAGEPAESNDVALTGLNHKMGFRGTINTALNFGENDDCIGWLVGDAETQIQFAGQSVKPGPPVRKRLPGLLHNGLYGRTV
jgi:butyryl-CoA dehydrogenase